MGIRMAGLIYTTGKYRCAECKPEQQTARGCKSEGVEPIRIPLRSGELRTVLRCPRSYMTPERLAWLHMHTHWSQGRFWHGPVLSAWPKRDLWAMEMLDEIVAEHHQRCAEMEKTAAALNARNGGRRG